MQKVLPILLCCCLGGDLTAPPGAGGQQDPQERAPGQVGYNEALGVSGGLIPLDLADLCREAELIVRGRVTGNRCLWDAGHTMIWTETTVRVIEAWKGDPGEELRIREPGGELPPVEARVSLAVRYRPGEQVVVFLHRDPLGQWRTCGITQGRFPVQRAPGGGTRVLLEAVPAHVGAGFFTEGEDPQPPEAVEVRRLKATVEALRAQEGGKR